MPNLLAGKCALIMGGGGEIGRATAVAFAREGAQLVIADLIKEAADATVGVVKGAGCEAVGIACDVTRSEDAEAAVQLATETFGGLDCAFNNAGIGGAHVGAGGKRLAEWSEEAYSKVVDVNLKGVWLGMKFQIPAMQARGGGAIVNTSSIAGLRGLPGSSAYVAAKHGVLGLTKSAAIEYAIDGIRVNAVSPGTIESPMSAEPMRRRGAEVLAEIPMGRIGRPIEIAELVLWLCSDHASYTTGATFSVDGGQTAR